MDALIKYPLYDEASDIQYFPFRTFSMFITIAILIISSITAHVLFEKGIISMQYDKADAFKHGIKPFTFNDMFDIHGIEMTEEYTANGKSEESELMTEKKNNNVELDGDIPLDLTLEEA